LKCQIDYKWLLKVINDFAKGLFDIGIVDAKTMHEFEALCLPPIKSFTPQEIKTL
jgi:putative transcriptional regulator